MSGLEYNIRLAEHGRLAGDLLLVGDYSRGDGIGRDMPNKRIVWHTYVGNARTKIEDVQGLAKKSQNPVPRVYRTVYPDTEARLIPLDFFLVEPGHDLLRDFPKADIAEVKGKEIAKAYMDPSRNKKGSFGVIRFSRKDFEVISKIFMEYEAIYQQGIISWGMMNHIESTMWLPGYWYRTRRVEKMRRRVEEVAFTDREEAKKRKAVLDQMVEALNRKATQSP